MIHFRSPMGIALGLLLAAAAATPLAQAAPPQQGSTTTPIQHVVVIFQENASYDHYFATYPNATNPPGEPAFDGHGKGSDSHGLSQQLLTNNPNLVNPKRLDRSQALTCDMNHDYLPEQEAADGGKMDKFIQNTQSSGCGSVTTMDYYDGNTVTALWNYAQNFAMSDNSFGSTYGPSTPGALNLVSGQTHGATPANLADNTANGSVIGDPDPTFDDCSGATNVAMSGKNVGDLLDDQGVTWGWFQGGFKPSSTSVGKAMCNSTTNRTATDNAAVKAYSAHHEPFEYYQSTANPHHLPPSAASMIGKTDQANHQYDLRDFWTAVNDGNMPAVSFLKAARAQDGHPGNSDPLDEQFFLVNTINQLEATPEWASTAVIVNWDDSDGWYDHVYGQILSPSNDPANDFMCGTSKPGAYLDGRGLGPRIPLLVISPFAKPGFIDHSLSEMSSIPRFIEDNWGLGQIGDQSFDARAGSLTNTFDFSGNHQAPALYLTCQGEPVPIKPAAC